MNELQEMRFLTSLNVQQRLINGTLSALSKIGNRIIDIRAAMADVELIANVRYGLHPAHTLDIFRPYMASRPLPVLLYIHGGGFVICSKDTHRSIALINAERAGYLVFNINYRLAPRHRFPAAIEDACCAYRWVVENAARYGGDSAHVVIAGESAGGNLALGVAIAATYRRPEPYAQRVYETKVVPAAVMPLMPYLQVSEPMRHAGYPGVGPLTLAVTSEIAASYLGQAAASAATLMADPVRILEECGAPDRRFPPVFSGVGTADLCCADVLRLESACRRLHIPVFAFYYEGERHAFHILRWRNAASALWRESIGFMLEIAERTDMTGDARWFKARYWIWSLSRYLQTVIERVVAKLRRLVTFSARAPYIELNLNSSELFDVPYIQKSSFTGTATRLGERNESKRMYDTGRMSCRS